MFYTKKNIVLITIPTLAVMAVLGLFYFISREPKIISIENESVESLKVENESIESDNEGEEIVEGELKPETEVLPTDELKNTEEIKEETREEAKEKINEDVEVDATEKKTENLDIKNKLVDWGFQKSGSRIIDTVVIHSSYNALGGNEYDVDLLIEEYKEYGVSPHYLISRKGNIYRLVEDKNIAYHAGESKTPDGRNGVNAFSIGIELINNKEDEYTKAQYASLNNLLDYLGKKYKIKYILGHNEVSPGRKDDPWNMEWGNVDLR